MDCEQSMGFAFGQQSAVCKESDPRNWDIIMLTLEDCFEDNINVEQAADSQ